jgi:hypothetical protein
MENRVGFSFYTHWDCSQSVSSKRANYRRIQTIISAALIAFCASPAHACVGGEITAALEQTLPESPTTSIDVGEPVTVEGGSFEIYKNQAGVAQTIVRTDYGETFRNELRLYILASKSFGFKNTKFEYSAPIYADGSKVIRKIIDLYEVCDGKLEVPDANDTSGDLTEYRKLAIDTFNLIGQAQELKAIVPALKLKLPPW